MFSMKALVELAKASLKVVSLFSVAIGILYVQAPKILQLPFRSLGEAVASASMMFPAVLGGLLVMLAVVALLDFLWQRHTHIKKLKMSKQEQKDEHKQTDGSPEVKAKIRECRWKVQPMPPDSKLHLKMSPMQQLSSQTQHILPLHCNMMLAVQMLQKSWQWDVARSPK